MRHAKKKNSDTFHESWFVNRESYNGVLLIKLNSWILTIVQRRLLSSSHTMLSLNLLLKKNLVGGFKYFVCSTLPGEMIQFDEHIFQMGWFNHQPENHSGFIYVLAVDVPGAHRSSLVFRKMGGFKNNTTQNLLWQSF